MGGVVAARQHARGRVHGGEAQLVGVVVFVVVAVGGVQLQFLADLLVDADLREIRTAPHAVEGLLQAPRGGDVQRPSGPGVQRGAAIERCVTKSRCS